MKIAFIQTYPIYHEVEDPNQWLQLENRDKWMPGILAQKGYNVELWATSIQRSSIRYKNEHWDSYPIELFPVSKRHKNSKFDYSEELTAYAQDFDPELVFLKGVDGGTGIHLLKHHLLDQSIPFVFIIGGKYYNRFVPKADGIFYETEFQKQKLISPGWKLWRSKIPASSLMQLPKSINTSHFAPNDKYSKDFDIVSVGRLISNYKNYDPLGELSKKFKVALIGGGPLKDKLKQKYPDLHLPGFIPNNEIPNYLNRCRLFFHTGLNDYFPRVIPEAMACGLPCLAFSDAIAEEVIPDGCGLRLPVSNFQPAVEALLADPTRLEVYSKNVRRHAVEHFGLFSSAGPLNKMIELIRQR